MIDSNTLPQAYSPNATLGALVHVIEIDSPVGAASLVVRAAIVSGINDDGTVNLSVFRPSGVAYVRSVAHNEPTRDANGYLQPALLAQQADSWHWPTRLPGQTPVGSSPSGSVTVVAPAHAVVRGDQPIDPK